jgi:hypothetical protein
MKKFDPKRIIGYLIITLFAINGNLYSQSSSFGNTYIFNNGEMGIVNIQHNFFNGGSGIQPGIVGTDRTVTQGFMSFVGTASWTGASDAMHVDGYVKTYMTTAFTFPIGDNGKYRPAAVSTAALANPANAAYYGVSGTSAITSRLRGGNEPVLPASGPFNTALKDADVVTVDNVEYWDINGATSSKITLTWDATSAITSLSTVSILGWNGTQWVAIPSTVDVTSLLGGASSLTSGSITTTNDLVPNTYEVYTLGTVCVAGSAPVLSSTTLTNICPAASVDINALVTSSTPSGYSLVWFTNDTHTGTAYATPTAADAGTYYAFYFDSINNCYSLASAAVTVTIAPVPNIPTVASTTQPNCNLATGTIVFTVQSGVVYSVDNGASYQSSPTFSGLTAGTYTLKVRNATNASCSADAASTVTIVAAPSAPILSTTTLANGCPATTVNLTTITASNTPLGTTLTWHAATPATLANTLASPSAVTMGTYYAAFYDTSNNCFSATTVVIATVNTCIAVATPPTITTPTGTTIPGKNPIPISGSAPFVYTDGSSDPGCIAPSGFISLLASGGTVNGLSSTTGAHTVTAPAVVGSYYYCIKVCDSLGNCAISIHKVLVTESCPVGSYKPIVN